MGILCFTDPTGVPTNKYEYTYDENGKRTLYNKLLNPICSKGYEYTYDGTYKLFVIQIDLQTINTFVQLFYLTTIFYIVDIH